ncbi:MAG: DUF1343 domain-containing protein, partial [Saprospiraceae bacterium]|nr:DUF1343 domain-containing protein [Saprospiraceae bacterium]
MLQTILQLAFYTLVLFSCISNHEDKKVFNGRITPGAENTTAYFDKLGGKSLGIIVNQTSMVQNKHLVDTLISAGFNIKRIFAPEHGFRGTADAGETVDDSIDDKTGIEIVSLYGKNKKPQAEQLRGIDLLIFDIQDVGVRFYTYISTLHYVMEAAAENDIPVMVLDRPNPNRHIIDGPVLDPEFSSFVGMHQVPVLYGLTIGEYAMMINGEQWLEKGMQCDLEVIPVLNYKANNAYVLPVRPSPNLPNQKSIVLYPGLCFFEGTSISVGRGTNHPFQHIGHPAFNVMDYSFTPFPNEGAKYPKHDGKRCYGHDLRSSTPPDRLDISYLIEYHKLAKEKNIPFFNDNNFFDKLAGTDKLKSQILSGESEDEIRLSWAEGLN